MKVKFTVWILIFAVLGACQSSPPDTAQPGGQASQPPPSSTLTETLFPSPTPSPVPSSTATSTPAPSLTPTPSETATPTATATYAPLDSGNVSGLKLDFSLPDWFIRGQVQSAGWTQEDRYILLETDKGLHFLEPDTLVEAAVLRGFIPKSSAASGMVIAAKDSTLGWVDLDTLTFHEIDIPGPEYGWAWTPLAVNPDGTVLAVNDLEQADSLVLYSLPAGEMLNRIQLMHPNGVRRIYQVLFSPDGNRLYVDFERTDGRQSLASVDLEQPDRQTELAVELTGFDDLHISPDGKRLAFFGYDLPTVLVASSGDLWSTQGMRFPTLIDNVKVYFSGRELSFRDSDSLGIAYTSSGGTPRTMVLVWDINTGAIIQTYAHTPGNVNAFDFSHDGERFTLAGREGRVQVYDREGSEIAASEPYDLRGEVDISPDGRLAAVPSIQGVRISDLETGEVVQVVGEYPGARWINAHFSSPDTLVVSVYPSSGDGFTELWRLDPLERVRKFDISGCRFSADRSVLACESKYIQVLEAERGSIIGSFGTAYQTHDYRLSPDGRYLALCSASYGSNDEPAVYSEAVGLWDLSTSTRVRNLLMDGPACGLLAFSPQGDYLVSSTGGIWHIPDGELVGQFQGFPWGRVTTGPANDLLLFEQDLIEIPTGRVIGQVDLEHRPQVIRFTDDGIFLVVLAQGELYYYRVME